MAEAAVAHIREGLFRKHPELCKRIRLRSLTKRMHDCRYLDLWTLLLQGFVEAADSPHVCYVSKYPEWGPCLAFERCPATSALVQRTVDRLQWAELETLPATTLEGRTMETYILPDAVVTPPVHRPKPLSLLAVFTQIDKHGGTDLLFTFQWRSGGQDCRLDLVPVSGQKRLKFEAYDGTVGGLQHCASVAGFDATKLSVSIAQATSLVTWRDAKGIQHSQSLAALRAPPTDETAEVEALAARLKSDSDSD